MPETIRFLDMDFDVAAPERWRELFLKAETDGFRYLVTPNVDHVVQLAKRPELAAAYVAADWRLCDSRVLERLGRLRKIELHCYPGADLVRDLLADPRARALKIAVVGPNSASFAVLSAQMPEHDLVLVPAPMMQPGSVAWAEVLAATEVTQADMILLCLSFPKQELFAHELKARGMARGTALCVGASIDFLTGEQTRAPEVFRRHGMEWLYRLLSQPGRLWKRYLIDGPKIFWIYLKDG